MPKIPLSFMPLASVLEILFFYEMITGKELSKSSIKRWLIVGCIGCIFWDIFLYLLNKDCLIRELTVYLGLDSPIIDVRKMQALQNLENAYR